MCGMIKACTCLDIPPCPCLFIILEQQRRRFICVSNLLLDCVFLLPYWSSATFSAELSWTLTGFLLYHCLIWFCLWYGKWPVFLLPRLNKCFLKYPCQYRGILVDGLCKTKLKLFYKGQLAICSLRTIYKTNAAIKSKINRIIPATLFDSCGSWILLPNIKIIAVTVHHTTLMQWSTFHIAWMNYGCRLTKISISEIFDKAEWNLTMWEAGANQNCTEKFTFVDALAEKVTRRKNDCIALHHCLWL